MIKQDVIVKDGKVSIVQTHSIDAKIKNKRKLAYVQHLIENNEIDAAMAYIRSHNGKRTLCHSNGLSKSWLVRWNPDLLEMKSPGSVLEKFTQRFDCGRSKKPLNESLGQWIGVEIECVFPRGSYDDIEEIREDLKEKRMFRYVTVKHDGSISRGEMDGFGVEFTVVFKRSDNSELVRLLQFINAQGAKVNKSCGLHIHLDCRDLIDAQSTRKTSMRLTKRANNIGRNLIESYCKAMKWTHGGIEAVQDNIYMKFNGNEMLSMQNIEPRGFGSREASHMEVSLGRKAERVSYSIPVPVTETSSVPFETQEEADDFLEACEYLDASCTITDKNDAYITLEDFRKLDSISKLECCVRLADGTFLTGTHDLTKAS